MALTIRLANDGSSQALGLPTGAATVIRVRRRFATWLELDDICFGHDRSLMVPGPEEGKPRSPLFGALIAICDYAKRHPEQQVLVAGHTDTSGADDYNRELSERRANNVALWLSGDDDAWAADCDANFERADFKAVQRWAHDHLGWNTDPGELDNEWHERARIARDRFRTESEALLDITLEHDVAQNVEDWKAIAQLYAFIVSRYLEITVEELGELRKAIVFTEPRVLACGEDFPRDRPDEDGVDSAANRRVEVVFFEPEEVPDLTIEPPGQTLYGPKRFKFRQLRSPELFPIEAPICEVDVLAYDYWHRKPLGGLEYRLEGPLPECLFVREGVTEGNGGIKEDTLPSGHYRLTIGEGTAQVLAHGVGFADPGHPQLGPDFRDVVRLTGHRELPLVGPPPSTGSPMEWRVSESDEFPDVGDDDLVDPHDVDIEDPPDDDDDDE